MRVLSYISILFVVIGMASLVAFFFLTARVGSDHIEADTDLPHWLLSTLLSAGLLLVAVSFVASILKSLGDFGVAAGFSLVGLVIVFISFDILVGVKTEPHWDAFVKASKFGNGFEVWDALQARDQTLSQFWCKGVRWYYNSEENYCYVYDFIYNPFLIQKSRD